MPMPVGHGGVGGKALARRFEGLGPRRCCIGQPGWARHARMAGGDYDGDLNMFSFDKDLLDVAKATEDRIRQLPVEDLDQQVKDRMMELELEKAMDEEVEFELRGYSKNELEALFAGDNKLPAYLQFCL